ncbi:hypothetical protein BH09BAC5_BH09BAC5_12410 [soil metagenome]
MHTFLEYRIDIAVFLTRLVLGILFFFQGYDKIFRLGLAKTENAIADALHNTKLPVPFVKFTVAVSSLIELIAGLMLIAGFLIYPALAALGIDLLIVVFAMSLREPLWDMRYLWPRLVLLLLLLLLPALHDRISIDHLMNIYGN